MAINDNEWRFGPRGPGMYWQYPNPNYTSAYNVELVKCPVCEGRQSMPAGFYYDQTGADYVTCRSCDGKGYVSVPQYTSAYGTRIEFKHVGDTGGV